MLEIVFSDSARGSLNMAANFGKGAVHGFQLALSVGDISGNGLDKARWKALCWVSRPYLSVPGTLEHIDRSLETAAASLAAVLHYSAAGEPVRLWYSNQPDEICGFHWMLAQLDGLGDLCGPVLSVKLPRYAQRDDGVHVSRNGWGEVLPKEWHQFLSLERAVTPAVHRSAVERWHDLQRENAPFRAVMNGRLISIPEDFYDNFIRWELTRTPGEFHEARFIGNIISHFQLGISDGLISNRIQEMVAAGELEVVAHAEDGRPNYHRILRKLV